MRPGRGRALRRRARRTRPRRARGSFAWWLLWEDREDVGAGRRPTHSKGTSRAQRGVSRREEKLRRMGSVLLRKQGVGGAAEAACNPRAVIAAPHVRPCHRQKRRATRGVLRWPIDPPSVPQGFALPAGRTASVWFLTSQPFHHRSRRPRSESRRALPFHFTSFRSVRVD